MKGGRRSLLIAWELDTIRQTVNGARLLEELLVLHQAPDEVAERQIPKAVVGILNLTTERLRMVAQMCTGDRDSSDLVAEYNSIEPDPEARSRARRTDPKGRGRSNPRKRQR